MADTTNQVTWVGNLLLPDRMQRNVRYCSFWC